jgi:predicted kinase
VQRFLEDHEDLIDQREKEGWVRECHGDLHAGNVCMTDPVRIYDCIEFNRRFRVSDILADIAFLLMDIDHHGRADLAALLLKAYRERLAAPVPDSLLCFYKVYRAAVRGKISSFLSADPDVTAERRERSRLGAIDYFNRALGYLIPPSLLITCGLMGTGKSRLAAALAPALHGEVIRSDVLRLRFKQAPDEGARAGFGQGPYSRETTDIVYRLLAEQARELLTAGRTVILDASFADDGQRRRMQQLAIECNVPFAVLYCTIPRTVTLQRLQNRTEQGRDASDGRVELYDRQAAGFHYPTEDEPVIGIDTSGPVDLACNNALARLEAMIGASGQKKDAV